MPIEILMPALSPTMTEGTLTKWLKQEGETIKAGDVIAEIETDKATMEVEAVDEGVLGRILVPAGTAAVPVNVPIALLLSEGEDRAALAQTPAASSAPGVSLVTQAPEPPPASAPAAPGAAPAGRVFASPLAKRLAAEAKLDLHTLSGSGPHGRIVQADVEAAIARAQAAPPPPAVSPPAPVAVAAKPAAPAPCPAAPAAAGSGETRAWADKLGLRYRAEPTSSMRKVIARRLSEAKQTIPHFYLTADVTLDALLALRAQLNAEAPTSGPEAYKLSVNDFVVRAVALALRKVPGVNAAWAEDAILHFESVDVSVAVATPAGLITPIVKQADRKGLATIANELKSLAQRAREGKLTPEDYQGGTLTVSNLGMYGVREFAAIINPPQASLLAVGAAEPRPVVRDGALAVATQMTLTLSLDHRVIDGALGARFLAAIKGLLEKPLTMLL